jgi:hypothetical protein
MMKNLFGYSKKNRYDLTAPQSRCRHEFFQALINYIKTPPPDFPDPENRKRRKLETLEPAPPPIAPPPRPLTKQELKDQKKRDRQTLNLLKIRIQPIMDQIKKYKRFRTGVIDESQIRYLYEDEDPNIVTTDLPLEQRTTFRPFEKDVDKQGVPGLRETVSGKFYYNLEIVTIEKRLSNGYYKRPQDFLADIRRIAKDARRLGEYDRMLRANELLSNVEVDIAHIEQSEPGLVAECENVYRRELERERLAIEKAKQAAEADGIMCPPLTMNVPHGNVDSSNVSSGPVVLGEPFNGLRPKLPTQPVAPSRLASESSLTNGYPVRGDSGLHEPEGPSRTSNISLISKGEGDADGDLHMSNSDDVPSAEHEDTQHSSFGPSAQPRPPHSYTAPSQQLRHRSGLSNLSQKGTMTPMAPNSQPGDYANDASTTQTTSDKKNSGPSDGHQFNTQSSIGLSLRHEGPDLMLYPDRLPGDDHLPDTQQGESAFNSSQHTPPTGVAEFANSHISVPNGSQSQPRNSQHGSQPPVPRFEPAPQPETTRRHYSIHELLGSTDRGRGQNLIVDNGYIDSFHHQLTQRTSGLSVEQLEQINTSLMDSVWKMRGEWNRNRVAKTIIDTFNSVLEDMQSMQEFGPISQNTKQQLAGS